MTMIRLITQKPVAADGGELAYGRLKGWSVSRHYFTVDTDMDYCVEMLVQAIRAEDLPRRKIEDYVRQRLAEDEEVARQLAAAAEQMIMDRLLRELFGDDSR